MRIAVHLLFVFLLTGCVPTYYEDPASEVSDASPPPDIGPPPNADWDSVLANYEADVHAFELSMGLPVEWSEWMIAKEDQYARAYVRGRTRPRSNVEVSYDYVIPYSPAWTSEEEHLQTLKTLAEETFSGWEFNFSFNDPNADLHMVIGYTGNTSHASGQNIKLIWEGIFVHEFGHTAGIGHHYCSSTSDLCNLPPGEGKCIMSRNSVTWGPTEQFLLNLSGRGDETVIKNAVTNLNSRYPDGYPANRP